MSVHRSQPGGHIKSFFLSPFIFLNNLFNQQHPLFTTYQFVEYLDILFLFLFLSVFNPFII
ncbi:unnamed protein product [Meloidogyne enterolobii]|uniref:Uncharacterized protein n=1 Tax=Meloidogyne enterolobii TaxID=390850 RepID=A0ACB1B436_MELEN